MRADDQVLALQLQLRQEHGLPLAARFWSLTPPMLAISSAPLGGGLGLRKWVLNAQVPHDFDGAVPAQYLAELAAGAGLTGSGIGMMTAVDVRTASVVRQEGVAVDATVGVTGPQWAAADDETFDAGFLAPTVGTINIVITLPERLSDAALVNAVSTATEAKSQALWEAGVGGTGTATDAICVLCPPDGTGHAYGGPRSLWGARLARAVHRAVLVGCRPGQRS
jgi:adenosylcobinamide hydrolase